MKYILGLVCAVAAIIGLGMVGFPVQGVVALVVFAMVAMVVAVKMK